MKNQDQRLVKIVISAMFAALCCVATMIIRVPTIGTNGYVNIGDTIVLTAAWFVGGPYGALAAGIGSGMADLLAGYGHYVLGTFIIKFSMALIASLLYKIIVRNDKLKYVGCVASAIVAETLMVLGYFAFEATVLQYGLAAAASIPSNIVQGVTCGVLGVAAFAVLDGTKAVRHYLAKK